LFFFGLVLIEFSTYSTYTDVGISQRFLRFIFHPPLIRKLDVIHCVYVATWYSVLWCLSKSNGYIHWPGLRGVHIDLRHILHIYNVYTWKKKALVSYSRRALARHRPRALLTVWRHLSSCSFSLLNGLKNINTFLHTIRAC